MRERGVDFCAGGARYFRGRLMLPKVVEPADIVCRKSKAVYLVSHASTDE
jgi:hypothetical protein